LGRTRLAESRSPADPGLLKRADQSAGIYRRRRIAQTNFAIAANSAAKAVIVVV